MLEASSRPVFQAADGLSPAIQGKFVRQFVGSGVQGRFERYPIVKRLDVAIYLTPNGLALHGEVEDIAPYNEGEAAIIRLLAQRFNEMLEAL